MPCPADPCCCCCCCCCCCFVVCKEWKGDFSDGSDAWTDELREEVGADDSEGDVRSVLLCAQPAWKYLSFWFASF